MPRYFIELAYKGTRYSGFQRQENANTVQAEVEKAFAMLHRQEVPFTGSSRTDAGVHSLQNYFHFDFDRPVHPQLVYKMNAILPEDIVIHQVHQMSPEAHCRFDATGREYEYRIHQRKNPFVRGLSLYYPFRLDLERMNEAAARVREQQNFYAFTKTNTQVKNFNCRVEESRWYREGDVLIYAIRANRFLRGMVRLLTATQLKVGRGKLELEEFLSFFEANRKCGHSVPADGLYLRKVNYPENYFP